MHITRILAIYWYLQITYYLFYTKPNPNPTQYLNLTTSVTINSNVEFIEDKVIVLRPIPTEPLRGHGGGKKYEMGDMKIRQVVVNSENCTLI